MNDASKKAKELVEKFKVYSHYDAHDMSTRRQREQSNIDSAKECAEICVDEIIGSYSQYKGMYDQDFFDSEISYWQKVKESIVSL